MLSQAMLAGKSINTKIIGVSMLTSPEEKRLTDFIWQQIGSNKQFI